MNSIVSTFRDYRTAVSKWWSIIFLVMSEEFDLHFKGTRLGALIAAIEPFLLVGALVAFHTFLGQRTPQYGESLALFYSSGILPFFAFLRSSRRAFIARYDAVHRLPRATSTDVVIAATLGETALVLVSTALWFFGMWLFGVDEAWPASIVDCIFVLLLFIAMGTGAGLINSAISRRFYLWAFIYGKVVYGLAFFSGIFFVVSLLAPKLRDIIVWVPLAHGVEWFRIGLYGTSYPSAVIDPTYFASSAMVLFFVGVVAHRATLRSVLK